MRLMADLLRQNRVPSEIVRWYAVEDARLAQEVADARPNDPCPAVAAKRSGAATAGGLGRHRAGRRGLGVDLEHCLAGHPADRFG